jgi:hypothetical protein
MSEIVKDAIASSGQWLLRHQDPKSGGWGDLPGKPPSSLNTAEVLVALMKAADVPAAHKQIRAGVDFLKHTQTTSGEDAGCWARVVTPAGRQPKAVPDLLRTCFAVEALVAAGGSEAAVESGVEWILDVAGDDGVWAFREGAPSRVLPTCFALLTLLVVHGSGLHDCREPITTGLRWLVAQQSETGSFGPQDRFEAVQTIYCALVLEEARECELSVFANQEKRALDWLLENRNQAVKFVEGTIDIDPDGDANYGFLYMTDALVVRALSDSSDTTHQKSETANGAMLSLRAKMAPNGGFFGERVFSWSTAKALFALCAARDSFAQFPVLKPETTEPLGGVRVGHVLTGVIVLVALLGVALAFAGRFNAGTGIFLGFLILACLLGYGRIGEKTFRELVGRIPFGGGR